MVMSLDEQIAALKEGLTNIDGRTKEGKENKAKIEKQIAELEAQNQETEAEKTKEESFSPPKAGMPMYGTLPPYKKIANDKTKFMELVKKAEMEGKLCGFDAENMTASIRE